MSKVYSSETENPVEQLQQYVNYLIRIGRTSTDDMTLAEKRIFSGHLLRNKQYHIDINEDYAVLMENWLISGEEDDYSKILELLRDEAIKYCADQMNAILAAHHKPNN